MELADCVTAAEQVMLRNIAQRLYGPNENSKPPTTWQRFKEFSNRAKAAWLVLTGKLDPYDGW